MLAYPVELEADDNGTVLVTFVDVSEAITFGVDKGEALLRAVDAFETALAGYIADRRDIPEPSPAKRRPTVSPTPLAAAKIALYQTMRAQGVSKAALGRRLGWHMPQVDRLLDLAHASRLDQIDTALRILGKALSVDVHDAA